jgi:hypothetical protein
MKKKSRQLTCADEMLYDKTRYIMLLDISE